MISYAILSTIASGMFLAAYTLFASRLPFHRLKRWVLISFLIIPLVLPFVQAPTFTLTTLPIATEVLEVTANLTVNEVSNTYTPTKETPNKAPLIAIKPTATNQHAKPALPTTILIVDWRTALVILYTLVALCVLLYRSFQLWHNYRYIQQLPQHNYQGYHLRVAPNSNTCYAYYRNIVIGDKLVPQLPMLTPILRHEATHVTQKHSFDLWLWAFVQSLQWFNPFLFAYKRQIQLNHEHLADAAALTATNNRVAYLQLLLQFSQQQQNWVGLRSGFAFATLQKRFLMIHQPSLSGFNKAFRLSMLAVGMVLVTGFTVRKTTNYYTPQEPIVVVKPPTRGDSTAASKKQQLAPLLDTTPLLRQHFELIAQAKKIVLYKGDTLHLLAASYALRKAITDNYNEMTKQEKRYAFYGFWLMLQQPPRPESPTTVQLEKFKNPNAYGIWIDGKRVPNTALNNYRATDFAHYSASKLYGAAKKGRAYSVQVNLETPAYFKEIWRDKKEPRVVIVWGAATPYNTTQRKKPPIPQKIVSHILDSVMHTLR